MNVLVVGGTGLLGSEVVRAARKRAWEVHAPPRADLDITDDRSITAFFLHFTSDWVINCAAYTAVDQAETDRDSAFLHNSFGPYWLAGSAQWTGARMLHMSTDFVFDGRTGRPYVETDEPNPLSVYGSSKLHGETQVLQTNEESVIVRSAWLFGKTGKCFPKTALRAAMDGNELRVVNDQTGSPSYAVDIAAAIVELIEKDPPPGIYHVVNDGQATWFDLASECLKTAGLKGAIRPICTQDWPTAAARPKYSALDAQKYQALGCAALPHWKDAVRRFIEELRMEGYFTS